MHVLQRRLGQEQAMSNPRNTIGDNEWKGLQDRANGGNDVFDKEATKHRKIMSDVYKNRDKN